MTNQITTTNYMILENIDLGEARCFSPLFLDYLNQKKELKDFYEVFPSVKNFEELINNRQFSEDNRNELNKVLVEQYGPLKTTEAVDFNIHSLTHERTFTITTGHQLNIFSGPLYFIYKIVTTINLCKALRKQFPDYNFVPVYWMATEDHDFAEINHFHLFGKRYEWQTDQRGPVGRFKPHSMNTVFHELPETVDLFEQAYLDFSTLAEATRFYVNELFGDQGLVVVDADHAALKELFVPVIKKEIFESVANPLVEEASSKLNNLGYKSQVFSREINFFYIDNEIRERIVREEGGFKVLNTDLFFTDDEMFRTIEERPEHFSPNVITRPIYQETILPNLGYVGGPAEISYWLQLKEAFKAFDTFFPALIPRNFALVINKANAKKFRKLDLPVAELFGDVHQIKTLFLKNSTNTEFDLKEEKKEMGKLFEKLKKKAEAIDKSLAGFIGAESAKSFKILDEIGKKIKKSEENNNETAMSQIDNLKEKLFPEGNLQERHDNFLNFYLNHPDFIQLLLDKFDAFDFRFNILMDE
ncbi:MAG: bacillithiol biosynthesis cysteine-adding enzyme BshC [Bacteroidota bacterium]